MNVLEITSLSSLLKNDRGLKASVCLSALFCRHSRLTRQATMLHLHRKDSKVTQSSGGSPHYFVVCIHFKTFPRSNSPT